MQLAFKTYFFCSIRFYSNMCQVYSTKKKVDLFFSDALEHIMIFML